MILEVHADFVTACREICALRVQAVDSHHRDAAFQVGEEKRGFCLAVDSEGWRVTLNGVEISKQHHFAAPLSNFQAALVYLTSNHG
jgi:hypothetical protein